MIRSYGWRIALFAIGGLLVGLGISMFMPQKYEAVMQILVDQSPVQNSRMMTNAEQSVSDLLQSPRPRTVATQVEQLTGFGVLSRAVQKVAEKRNIPPGSMKELDLMNLQRSINVEAATDSDIIALSLRMPDKELAKDILTEIYLAFDDQNQQISREVGARALTFLESQTGEIQKDLEAVDGKLQAMRTTYNAPAVDVQIQTEIQTLRALEESYNNARIEYAAAQANAQTLSGQMKGVPASIQSSETTGINANYQRLEGEIAAARAEKAMLLTQWKPGSQAIKSVDERIKNLEEGLKASKPNIKSGTQTSTNPLYQTLSAQLAQANSSAAAAHERVTVAAAALKAKQTQLERMPEVQRKSEELRRQQDSLTRTYMQYKDSLDSLKVAQRGRFTPSTLVSPAFVNPDPVSPNLTLNLGAGLLAGLLLGVLTALGSESKKSPIRNLTQLNRLAFEPSFRTIPELPMAKPVLGRMPDDSFVALLGNFVRSNRRPYRLGVMGVDEASGASTTAMSLAVAASMEERSTLLVDTTEKKGAGTIGTSSAGGTAGGDSLLVLKSNGGDLDEIFAAENDRALCVFDLQPYRGGSNPMGIVSHLDECILLVRAGQTRSVDFLQAQQMLMDAGVSQVTVVLSRARNVDDDFSFIDPEPPALAAR